MNLVIWTFLTILFLCSCNPISQTTVDQSFHPGVYVSLTKSVLTTSSSTVLSGHEVELLLSLKDSSGAAYISPMSVITMEALGGTSTGTVGAIRNNLNGTYSATFTGVVAGSATTIRAFVNGEILQSSLPQISVLSGEYDAGFSTLNLSSSSVTSGSSINATVVVRDDQGNQLNSGGYAVTLAASGGASTVSFGATIDNNNGTYTIPITGIVAGTATEIKARIAGSFLTSVASSLSVQVGPASSLTISGGNNQSAYRGSVLSSAFSVVAKDINNNLVNNATINWTVISGGGSLSAAASVTNSSGVATSTLTLGTDPVSHSVRATLDGSSTSVTFSATGTTRAFTHNWTLEALNVSTNYDFTTGKIEFLNGVARLVATDQLDSDDTTTGFGGGVKSGVSWDNTNGILRLTGSNTGDVDSSWTPNYSSIVEHIKFNGTVGNISNNATISQAIGTSGIAKNANGTGFAYVAGKLAQGISLDGVDDYVDLGNPTHLDFGTTSSFTVSMWIKYSSCSSLNRRIFSTGSLSNSNGVSISCNGGGSAPGQLLFVIGASGVQANGIFLSAGENLNDNVWHLISLSVNQTTKKAQVYIDGALAVIGSIGCGTVAARTLDFSNVSCAPNGNNSGLVTVGSHTGTQYFWNGQFDELIIWNTALTEPQVATLYNRQASKYTGILTSRVMDSFADGQSWTSLSWVSTLPFNKSLPGATCSPTPCTHNASEKSLDYPMLVGATGAVNDDNLMSGILSLWHLDEASGTTGASSVIDRSGYGAHGTPGGNLTFGSTGILGFAGKFDGVNDFVDLGLNTRYDFGSTTSFTISMWVNWSSCSSNMRLISNGSGSNSNGFLIYCNGSGGSPGKLGFVIGSGGSSANSIGLMTNNTYNDNKWHHLVMNANQSTKQLRVFIDGSLATVTSFLCGTLTANVLDYSACPAVANNSGKTTIGSHIGLANFWNGYIDEVAIWTRALQSAEILQLYRRGANRIKYQVRTCSTVTDCTDDSTGANWKGPDGTVATYFSELQNRTTQATTSSGAVKSTLPVMTFSNFTSPVGTSRYFQYRMILESDDAGTACSYGSGATWCSPEVKSTKVEPIHYDSTAPSVYSKTGVSFWDLSTFTETIGANGCLGGLSYNLSLDKTTWYYWNTSAWVATNLVETVTQSNPASVVSANASTFDSIGKGTIYFKAFLKSNGNQPCELDDLEMTGVQ